MRKRGRAIAALASAGALATGLFVALGGGAPAGASSSDTNIIFAVSNGPFAMTHANGQGTHVSFGLNANANLVSFHVNGQAYGAGSFSVPSGQGPTLSEVSSAHAEGDNGTGLQTNAIAINVDVISGPLTTTLAPTSAIAVNNGCNACNTLAADYTFVVSPGVAAQLTPDALAQLYALAGQLTADANTHQSAQATANEVIAGLNQVGSILESGIVEPVATSGVAGAAEVATPVQQFGSYQIAVS